MLDTNVPSQSSQNAKYFLDLRWAKGEGMRARTQGHHT